MLPVLLFLFSLLRIVASANHFAGIVASNAVGGTRGYICRTQQQWNDLASDAQRMGFPTIRITGFDCDGLERASLAAATHGLQILAGIYVQGTIAPSSNLIDTDVKAFISAFRKFGKTRYIGITVGNEVDDTPENIMRKVLSVRSKLHDSGIDLPVSTVHVWTTIQQHLGVFCQADFIGANAHAFYDGKIPAVGAGRFVFDNVVRKLQVGCPGKRVIITESGWPSRGAINGAAVPSLANEANALSSLHCEARRNQAVPIFAFEYDDQLWKVNEDERSFGILGRGGIGSRAIASSC